MQSWFFGLACGLVAWALVACGKGPNVGGDSRGDLDGDPLALLPGSAVVVANLDARAIFDNATVGAPVAAIAARFVPLGDDAGFQASRDVDRITLGSYATGAVDVVAVIRGRFDTEKIAAATKAANGADIVRGLYGGRTIYTVPSGTGSSATGATVTTVTYCVLSAKTVVAGSGEGLRRLLERIQSGSLERSMAPWAAQTLDTPGADVAVAADFSGQPLAAAAFGSVHLPWLKGLRVARVIGNFEAPGLNVAATLTYTDADQAQAAVAGVRSIDSWLNVLGPLFGGLRLQNLQVSADGANVEGKFALDEQALRVALAFAPRLLDRRP
jgi:hypothetical protein